MNIAFNAVTTLAEVLNSLTALQHALKNSQLQQGKTSLLAGRSPLLLSPMDGWEALSVKVVLWRVQ